MNKKRVVFARIVSAVAMFALDGLYHGVCLAGRYRILAQQGRILSAPAIPYMTIAPVLSLIAGLLLAWFYASVRPRLGAGPRTAIKLGLAVAILAAWIPDTAAAAWDLAGKRIALYWAVMDTIKYVVGSLLAGWLYQEKAPVTT